MQRRASLTRGITAHRGRIVKTTGDGLLAEFLSVIDALRCAVEWQAEVPTDNRIAWRIGIDVGDVVVDDGDGDMSIWQWSFRGIMIRTDCHGYNPKLMQQFLESLWMSCDEPHVAPATKGEH
jgi:hypothetical protein